jgi:carboxymethylenebutenolidase
LTSADGAEFAAAFAESPEGRGPAVIILPDVRGLYRFYVELAERFAEAGHHAIAIDYFGRSAGVEERGEDFDFMAHLEQTDPAVVQQDIASARAALADRTGAETFASVGFCFGGSQSFLAGRNQATGLDAVVAFYGTLDPSRTGLDFLPAPLAGADQPSPPVLGIFGGDDAYIPAADIEAFDRALTSGGVEHEFVTYPGAPHSFFDRSYEEHADASADAWRRVLAFLGAGL